MLKLRLLPFLVLAPLPLAAQQKPASPAPAAPAISPLRQELLESLDYGAHEAVVLAKAVPEEKYSWRPMEGVRSFNEVFMHMAGSTMLFCSYAGAKLPEGPAHDLAAVYMKRGFELPELFAAEAAVNDKAKVVEVMEQSFEIGRDTIRNMPDADLEKSIQFFGRSVTTRGLLIKMGNHLNQHLGQAIAYARVNHIVPPWSEKKVHTEVPIDPKLLDGYVGRYELEVAAGMIFTVTRDKDQLSVQLTGQPVVPIFPEGPRDFFFKVVEAQITFEVDASGRAVALVLHQFGDNPRAKRIE